MRWVLLVLCGGVVPWLVGCAGVASSYAEREIERRAAEYLGPADRYDADVRGLTASSARQVVLVGTRVRPRPQLVLDTLTLDLRGVAYRRDPFAVTRVEDAAFTARVTDEAVNAFLQAQGRTANALLSDARVTFLPNEVRVAADMRVAGETIRVTTAGIFQAQGATVQYLPQRLAVAGLPVPVTILPQFAALINPAADLAGLGFTPRIQTITIVSGAVTLAGQADTRGLFTATP